ncbi:MAG TPA: hypothetical protein VIB82_06165 [Caulobacteraceae bacterium]|jgi:hypothetical protein
MVPVAVAIVVTAVPPTTPCAAGWTGADARPDGSAETAAGVETSAARAKMASSAAEVAASAAVHLGRCWRGRERDPGCESGDTAERDFHDPVLTQPGSPDVPLTPYTPVKLNAG